MTVRLNTRYFTQRLRCRKAAILLGLDRLIHAGFIRTLSEEPR